MSYEGLYEVSTHGSVRSLSRMTPGRWDKMKLSPGRLLKQQVSNIGYMRVQLSKAGVKSHKLVHRLVAEAFINNKDGKRVVNHKDFNTQNNRVDNLEWLTHKQNTRYSMNANRTKFVELGKSTSKEFCKYGHPLSGDNLYVLNGMRKGCNTCKRESNSKYRQRRRANGEGAE